MIRIEDFCDMKKFEDIMKNWAMSTGLATVAVGADGKYISECYNFTEFCIDLTRGSAEGRRRCEKCDREGKGVYSCHAGLVDFGIPITLDDGTVLGSVIGGQVLPEHPDDDAFRKTAGELGIDAEAYVRALHKVNVKRRGRKTLIRFLLCLLTLQLPHITGRTARVVFLSVIVSKMIGVCHTDRTVTAFISCTDLHRHFRLIAPA